MQARAEIYEFIHRLVADGLGCVVISSDLEELLGLCHRIAVMRAGQIAGIVEGEQMTEEKIMLLATGTHDDGPPGGLPLPAPDGRPGGPSLPEKLT